MTMAKGRPSLNLNETLHFSVDENTKQLFVQTADRMSINRSSILRTLLSNWLEQNAAAGGGN